MGYGATMGKQVFMLRWGFFSCWWTCETEQTFTHLLSCLPVTVQCTRDGQFVVVVARDATLPPIELDSIDLLETDDVFCTSVDSTSAFAIFQFPVTACGTTVTVGGGLSRQFLIWKYNLIGFITWTVIFFSPLPTGGGWFCCLWKPHVVVLWSRSWPKRLNHQGQPFWVSLSNGNWVINWQILNTMTTQKHWLFIFYLSQLYIKPPLASCIVNFFLLWQLRCKCAVSKALPVKFCLNVL